MSKKKVLITGGTRGIGKSISEIFHVNNYSIYITGTKEIDVPDYIDGFFIVDFTNDKSVKSFLDEISKIDFDVLINNAGINIIKEIGEVSDNEFNKIFDVNIKTPYFLIQKILPKLKTNSKIVNISSIFGFVSKEKRSLYSSTKYAINGMTKSLSIELGPKNILINSVLPGFTETELTFESLNQNEINELTSLIPLGRFAKTNEIAELVYFLSSEKNTYITGQNIIIDGGFTSK
jgi:3-oxoacyl-[acyl-carrier protein] reductase